MNSSHLKWVDVISAVEKAHLEATKNLKVRQRLINRKYVHDADDQMQIKRQELSRKKFQELEQRLKIEQDIKKQDDIRKVTKQQKLRKEKDYSKDNFDLMLGSRSLQKQENEYPEHPFTSLVDEADKRRENFRQRLKRQNQINSLQEKIKKRQINQRKIVEKQQKQKYVNHVQAFYLKKIEDRNIFKNKYLKLSNPEKSQLLPSSNVYNYGSIEKDYQTINGQIMKQSKLKSAQIDDVLTSINKHVDMPDSSPAFLGRIPISTDRKRQLDYLEKSAYHKAVDKKRLKTEGDISDIRESQTRRYTTDAQQLPAIKNYYHNLNAAQEGDSRLSQKSKANSQSPLIKHFQTVNDANQIRNTTNQLRDKSYITNKYEISYSQQNRSQNTTKKVYSTYDIIQNKRKYVCI